MIVTTAHCCPLGDMVILDYSSVENSINPEKDGEDHYQTGDGRETPWICFMRYLIQLHTCSITNELTVLMRCYAYYYMPLIQNTIPTIKYYYHHNQDKCKQPPLGWMEPILWGCPAVKPVRLCRWVWTASSDHGCPQLTQMRTTSWPPLAKSTTTHQLETQCTRTGTNKVSNPTWQPQIKSFQKQSMIQIYIYLSITNH